MSANDCNGHGTHVAGTLGGTTYGVAKGVSIHAVRVLDCSGSGAFSTVIAGVDWVTANHLSPAVANMSLDGPAYDPLDTAVRNSIASGVTYAVAAGNGYCTDASTRSPERVVEALTVGATDISDVKADFSNGGTVVDLFAPGVNITSAWIGSDTATNTISGTSMATPHVAGVAALYLQSNPGVSPATVSSAITSNATAGKVASICLGSPNRLLDSIFAPVSASSGQPVPKDYDGDGRADIAVKTDDGMWRIDYASNGYGVWDFNYGGYGDSANREAPADYDGDGRADIAIKADDQGRFNIDYAWNGFGSWDASYVGYGFSDTKPAPGDYDGDGRADFAIKTDDGRWLIDYASNGFGAFDQTVVLQ